MAYDKQKVTIDLEEYNDLKEKSKEVAADKWLIVSKEIILTIAYTGQIGDNYGGQIVQKLYQKGIGVRILTGKSHIDSIDEIDIVLSEKFNTEHP